MEQEYKYYAFISYNSHDTKWGMRLKNRLENYRMPATLRSKHELKEKPIGRLFFAPTNIDIGELKSELKEKLKVSQRLIVVCSPHSAQSDWVGQEIEYFYQLGRAKQIYFFIVDGVPHSGDPNTECFHPIIQKLGMPETIGANIQDHTYPLPYWNKEKAYIQLITKMLGVEFDSVWRHHRRMLKIQFAARAVGAAVVVASLVAVWVMNQPVDIRMALREKSVSNPNLPPLHAAIVKMTLDEEVKTDTVKSLDDCACFLHVPHRYLNQEVRITISCPDYLPVETMVTLLEETDIHVFRNPAVYGDIQFRLWSKNSETFVSDTPIKIEDMATRSNAEGVVSLRVPLGKQKEKYKLSSTIPLEDSILYMPYGKGCVIRTK